MGAPSTSYSGFWFNNLPGLDPGVQGMKTAALTREAGLPAVCVLAAGGYSVPAGYFSKDRISTMANNHKDSNQKDLQPRKKMKRANALITTGHRFSQAYCPAEDAHHLDLSNFPSDYPITSYTILPSPPFLLSHLFPSAIPCGGYKGQSRLRYPQLQFPAPPGESPVIPMPIVRYYLSRRS